MHSPLKIFRSLKHGDPQAVAYTAVFVFLASVCWFSYTFLFPPTDESLPLGAGRDRTAVPEEMVSLSDILEKQRVFLTPGDIPNPFYREPPRVREPNPQGNPRNNPQPPAGGQPNQGTDPDPGQTGNPNPPPQPPAPPPKPKTRPMTLTYLGLLTRPDHTTVALLNIEEQSSRKFISVGDEVPPFRVNEITPEGMQIQRDNGPAIFLPRGVSQRFEVPL